MCYANAHAAIMESTCTELTRRPWITGGVGRVVTVRPNSHRITYVPILGSETISLVSCHMTYSPPPGGPIALSHRITYVPCRAAMAAPLSEVPQEGFLVFYLFSLIELHLAPHPLASSYSRVTFHQYFGPKIYILGPSVWGPVKTWKPYSYLEFPSSRALSLRNLVSGYDSGRVFPAAVGPGSPSKDASNWLPSRFSLSVETRRRYGGLRMVFPGARLF